MTKLREDEHLTLGHSNGIISADTGTFTAISTLLLIHLGNRDRDCLAISNGWF